MSFDPSCVMCLRLSPFSACASSWMCRFLVKLWKVFLHVFSVPLYLSFQVSSFFFSLSWCDLVLCSDFDAFHVLQTGQSQFVLSASSLTVPLELGEPFSLIFHSSYYTLHCNVSIFIIVVLWLIFPFCHDIIVIVF